MLWIIASVARSRPMLFNHALEAAFQRCSKIVPGRPDSRGLLLNRRSASCNRLSPAKKAVLCSVEHRISRLKNAGATESELAALRDALHWADAALLRRAAINPCRYSPRRDVSVKLAPLPASLHATAPRGPSSRRAVHYASRPELLTLPPAQAAETLRGRCLRSARRDCL